MVRCRSNRRREGRTSKLHLFGDLGKKARREFSKARVMKTHHPFDLMGEISIVDHGHPTWNALGVFTSVVLNIEEIL